ncbi:MAG: hypothetical protein OXG97_07035, partial [Candidatus Poribacteria bacterium]|nr:hypothetical protein [Candidatus Poribacteria bacterium]
MNLTRIATFAFVFAIVTLVIGLSGCDDMAQMVPDDTTTLPEMMTGEITIGMAVALTGDFAEPYVVFTFHHKNRPEVSAY